MARGLRASNASRVVVHIQDGEVGKVTRHQLDDLRERVLVVQTGVEQVAEVGEHTLFFFDSLLLGDIADGCREENSPADVESRERYLRHELVTSLPESGKDRSSPMRKLAVPFSG